MKRVSISVTEFALPVPRRGSIDTHSGFGRVPAMGPELHLQIQKQRAKEHPGYKAEVPIKREFTAGGYTFEVAGRIDGLIGGLDVGDDPRIEEIKSSFNIYDLLRKLKDAKGDHPYVLQLKTYGYFYWLEYGKIPELKLHLISTRNFETIDYDVSLDIPAVESWLALRLDELVEEAKLAEKRANRRRKTSEAFQFPFPKPRSGQIELIASIEEGMRENRPMLIQAPTGLGKTVGVLYPTLKEALGRGQRVIYVTPKNSQHSVAEDAVERLQDAGANIRAMTLTAKSKMCLKAEPICNPDFCEYAQDHYTKVAAGKLVEQLAKKKNLTARVFKNMAEEHQVCPFELQLDAAHEADAVICDYNYVFAPRSPLSRMNRLSLDQQGKPNLVIDEAHNLPSRTMDYYSPVLSTYTLEKMRDDSSQIPKKFRAGFLAQVEGCIAVLNRCAPPDCTKACRIDPPALAFLEQDVELKNFLSTYLKSDVEIEPRDPVLRLSFYWSEFTDALEFVSSGRQEFFTTFSPHPATVRITCCDASEMLKDCYDEYSQVVAFSATLKPFEFYSRLAGLQQKQLKTAEFISPFPKSQRKLLIIPQISSKYSERERNYPRIAETIEKIASLRQGNYFAFFPSFDFMEKVFARMRPISGFEMLKQERNMKRDEIDHVIERLGDRTASHLVFAVQGGVFSEGVDYPGDMVIGAFVVGPPLPNFDLEREKMREYYERNYSAGFDYAYTYPAMAKAVQAAGRVIRSETDRGIIVLMDNRFIQPSYVKSMPRDWYDESPSELVSQSILSDISDFWASADA